MREIIDVILEEKFDFDQKQILFSYQGSGIEKLELMLWPGQVYEDSFCLQAPEGKYVYGYILSSDSRMECVTGTFSGTEEIHFRFCGEHLEDDEVCRGQFLILSNQGQYILPYEVRAQREELWTSQGAICNLIQFNSLAKADWQEALSVFYSPMFERMIREKEPQLYQCYQAFSGVKRSEHNMDQFLIVAGKKQRMSYFVEESLLTLENPVEVAEISLGIMRNGWGYTRLDVETDGEFIFVEKEVITDDDFLGNRYKLSVYIDSEKLHAGKNFGRVILKDNEAFVEVPVEIYSTGLTEPGRERRAEQRKCSVRLTDIYQAFRRKELSTAKWLKETDQLVQKLIALDDQDLSAKLFFAHILITADRLGEAGWILEHFSDGADEISPELEAYHLYLSSLLRNEDSFTKQVAAQIEKIYREKSDSWRVAWLLLYVSREYEMNAAAKWLFLEEQFKQGSRSPIIYFEAMQLLNRNPSLLRKLERFELQVLYYGNKKGILTIDLLEQVYYLVGKVKEFSPLLYKILVKCYDKTQDERIVKEICTLLIKGNRVEKAYYRWFKLGIEAGIRITNLYEYYIMSLDLEKEEEIPKTVLLYFTYQSNLDHAHAAYLYSYVAEHREEYPEIYESYVHRIEMFVKEQVLKERISEPLSKLYQMFLQDDMVQKQNASAMVNILFSNKMKVPSRQVQQIYVYQYGSTEPKSYAVTQEYVWVPVYARDSFVVWEDRDGNRFPAGALFDEKVALAEHPIVKNASAYIEDNLYLDLGLYGARELTYEANEEVLSRFFRLWKSDKVCLELRRETAVRIMKYYYHTEDRIRLVDYLETLPMEMLTRREAAEAIKYMVYCRLDEMAYTWMDVYSPVLVDSKISASLLSAIIKKREYAPDVHLLCYAYETFEKGKYTNEILRYLAMHHDGTVYDQYQIWKAAYSCGIEVDSLSERLLTQMLFTGEYVKEHGEVLKKYLRGQVDEKLVRAYMIRRSYAYYLEGESLDNVLVGYILQAYESGMEVPVIGILACLKYYADMMPIGESELVQLLGEMVKDLMLLGIYLPWFEIYPMTDVDNSNKMDKTVLEYHAGDDAMVKFRYLPQTEDASETSWKIMNMYPVCRRVFFTEHVLFFGESIHYEILEERDGADAVMARGILKRREDCDQISRFQAVNEILEAKALKKDVQFETMLAEYMKKDFINSSLFRLM